MSTRVLEPCALCGWCSSGVRPNADAACSFSSAELSARESASLAVLSPFPFVAVFCTIVFCTIGASHFRLIELSHFEPMKTVSRNCVFISYSHEDVDRLRELRLHLEPFIREHHLEVWTDEDIRKGALWREETEKALASACVAVLLVSPAYLASESITTRELPEFLDAHRQKGLTILWVPLRASSVSATPIEHFRPVCDPERPLARLTRARRDEVWVRVADTIRQTWESQRASRPKALRPEESGPSQDHATSLLFNKTWEISKSHLTGVLNTAHYAPDGTRLAEGRSSDEFKFNEDLYVSPSGDDVLAGFLKSNKRGLILVGESGIGKTNLLCHSFLRMRQQHEPALFLSARRLDSPDFGRFISAELVQRISTCEHIEPFDQQLRSRHAILTVFLDAANEFYKGVDRPLSLLEHVVRAVEDDHRFRSLRVVVSCRSETWLQYKLENGISPLSPSCFYTTAGDAYILSGFATHGDRARLYGKYQQHFRLVPDSYDKLKPTTKALITQPLLMAVIAHTYSNLPAAGKRTDDKRSIRNDLDYAHIFHLLTDRKFKDAQLLLSASDPLRDHIPERLTLALQGFSRLLLRRLMDRGSSITGPTLHGIDNGDTLTIESLASTSFVDRLTPSTGVTIVDALLQVGLVKKVSATTVAADGTRTEVYAYRLFHDRYTEYCLAAVCSSDKLGRIATDVPNDAVINRTTTEIESILSQASYAPVLSGALDHWFYHNMGVGTSKARLLLPLFERLSTKPSATVRTYIGAFFNGLLNRGLLAPDILWRALDREGCHSLKNILVASFLDNGRDQPPGSLCAFLDFATGPADNTAILSVADIFAHLLSIAPHAVLKYLDEELTGFESLSEFLLTPKKLRHLKFLFTFLLIAIVSQFENPRHMNMLATFVRKKCKTVVDILIASDGGRTARIQQGAIRALLKGAGINMWNRAIGTQGQQEAYFLEPGEKQRSHLLAFYPYLLAFHNSEWDHGWQKPDSQFRALALDMLSFYPGSLVGYLASTTLPFVFRSEWLLIEEVLESLVEKNNEAARFSANLLLVNAAFINRELAPEVLSIMKTRVVPWLLREPWDDAWHLLGCTAVATIDLDRFWRTCDDIVCAIADSITKDGDEVKASQFGDALMKCCFYPDPRLGPRIARMCLRGTFVTERVWRNSVAAVLVGLRVSNPIAYRDLVSGETVPSDVMLAMSHVDLTRIAQLRERVYYETSWNKFIATTSAGNATVRRYLLKTLLAACVDGKSVDECGSAFARFVQELVVAMFAETKQPADNRLTMEDVFPRHRRRGRGAPKSKPK